MRAITLRSGHAGLAAIVLTRITAEDSEGPGQLTGRVTDIVAELIKREGPDAATELVIALAPQHFRILDAAAEAINLPVRIPRSRARKIIAAYNVEGRTPVEVRGALFTEVLHTFIGIERT